MRTDYIHVDGPSYHIARKKEILKKYPEVIKLIGNYPLSALYIVLIVATQIMVAYALRGSPWWLILVISYLFGAFCNHALYVLIHECGHNLVFKSSTQNRVMGIICDLALGIPGAMGFRKYHMMHHRYLGEYNGDPDVVSHTEARLVGNSSLKKIIWITLFSLSQGLRPSRFKDVPLFDRWIFANLFVVVAVDLLILSLFGTASLFYLLLSSFFALGLHPLGGRWIQEHYITREGQETYSYYGPLNYLTFNMGYHNEHHDLMSVPWVNLPKLKRIAPEYYDSLHSYQSWTKVLLNFITSTGYSPYERIVHPDKRSLGAE